MIAEDDDNKRARLVRHITARADVTAVVPVSSINSALRALSNTEFDLIILDMSMPTFDIGPDDDGGRPQAFGGLEILRQLTRRRSKAQCIVVTQFDFFGKEGSETTLVELTSRMSRDHAGIFLGSVYYDVRSDQWKSAIDKIIESVHKSNPESKEK